MPSRNSLNQSPELKADLTLRILTAVEENAAVSQRSVAKELGIALGLANAYLRRCVTKGYIKVTQAPASRYAYYLTPQGFAEKSRLTAEFLHQSFSLFRLARAQYSEIFKRCAAVGYRDIAVYGQSDLTEVVLLCARSYAVKLVGIAPFDGSIAAEDWGDLTVCAEIAELEPFDAVVLADLADPQGAYLRLVQRYGEDRVLAPRVLNVSRPQRSLFGYTDNSP